MKDSKKSWILTISKNSNLDTVSPLKGNSLNLPATKAQPICSNTKSTANVVTGKIKCIAIDTETTGLDLYTGDKVFAISAAWRDRNDEVQTLYVSFPVDPKTRTPDWSKPSNNFAYDIIAGQLADHFTLKIFHNAKFDLCGLASPDYGMGLEWNGPIADTAIAAACCDTLAENVKLKPLAAKYVGIPIDDEKALKAAVMRARRLAKAAGNPTHEDLEADYWLCPTECEAYARLDAKRTLLLWEFYDQGLDQLEVRHSYDKEIELLKVLFKMEQRGIRLSYAENIKEIGNIKREMEAMRKAFIEDTHCNPDINLNSPKQLLPVLQKYLAPREIESTGEDTLREFVGSATSSSSPLECDYPAIWFLLMYRGFQKGIGYHQNYMLAGSPDKIRNLEDMLDWGDAFAIHPFFHQGSSAKYQPIRTFRLSCSNPNLQNVPNPATSSGFNVTDGRRVFGPRQGYVWYCIDYSQLELRIFAARADEKKLMQVFLSGGDPHDATRRGIPFLAAKPEKIGRKIAKNANFCIINRGGARTLYKRYGIPIPDGKRTVEGFYELYPKTYERQVSLEKYALKHGHIINAFGRKLDIDPDKAYTNAPAYDIQSSAADLIKLAMIRLVPFLSGTGLDAHLVLSIHDELIFEVKREHCYKWLIQGIKEIMEDSQGAINLPTPVEVTRTLTSWSEKSTKGLEWINGN